MYLNCTTEKSAIYQRTLEKCMMTLMQTALVEEISISSLCQQTGISRKTFYRLFPTKTDVILAMLDHTIMDFETYIPDSSVGPGEIHRFLAFWKDQKPLLDALSYNQASSLLLDRALNHILTENIELLHLFGISDRSYGREMMMFYVSGLFSLVLDWHKTGYERSIDEMSMVFRTILQKVPVEWENQKN